MSLDAGISTNPQCLETFEKFKMKYMYDFVIFKTNDKMNEIIVDICPEVGESEKVWKDIGASCDVKRENDEPVEYWNLRRLILAKKEPRYATILIQPPSSSAAKLTMVYWSPDDAPSKQKMAYSSTKLSFKGKLSGLQALLQCNDLEELSYKDACKNTTKI